MIYDNHDNTTRSEKQYLEQNGSRSIQKGRKIRSYLYGSWSHDGYWNRRILGCRSLTSSTYFLSNTTHGKYLIFIENMLFR